MIVSGASGTLGYLPALQEGLHSFFGESFSFTFELILGILAGLTAIGGMGVIIGGFILTSRHIEAGRIIVMVSMGMGALSLIMSLVQLAWAGILAMPLMIQMTQSLGWIGAMMAIVARTISEQQPIIAKT
ncbi:MAG: hypothetical protein ACFFED_12220 [Candidatus Thorarchaeota archaeon]